MSESILKFHLLRNHPGSRVNLFQRATPSPSDSLENMWTATGYSASFLLRIPKKKHIHRMLKAAMWAIRSLTIRILLRNRNFESEAEYSDRGIVLYFKQRAAQVSSTTLENSPNSHLVKVLVSWAHCLEQLRSGRLWCCVSQWRTNSAEPETNEANKKTERKLFLSLCDRATTIPIEIIAYFSEFILKTLLQIGQIKRKHLYQMNFFQGFREPLWIPTEVRIQARMLLQTVLCVWVCYSHLVAFQTAST